MLLPDAVRGLIDRLERAGYGAWAVGGCVRDDLLGRVPSDWDMCTQATPDEVARVFQDERVLEIGRTYGTLTVFAENLPVQVTTLREDGPYIDHRRPDGVCFVRDLTCDLARRDFTVNAMAYSDRDGLVDLFGGQADMTRRVIRCVGSPEARFGEDALRIVRALRFAAQLDFEIEGKTGRAARALAADLRRVAVERVYAELMKLLAGPAAARVLDEYKEVMACVLPGAQANADVMARTPPDAQMRLALLLEDADVAPIMAALKADKRAAARVQWLCKGLKAAVPTDEIGLLRLLGSAGGYASARDLVALWRAQGRDVAATAAGLDRLEQRNACWRVRDLAVSGSDVMALGFSGLAVGRVLALLLERVICGQTPNERAALLAEGTKYPHTRTSDDLRNDP